MKLKVLLLLFLFSFPLLERATAQDERDEEDLLQFSGVVVRSDSLTPVPFTNIVIAGEGRGTVSDAQGYFSLVAQERDTIIFSSIGFERSHFIIPDSLEKKNYSLIHAMEIDTVQMQETTVHPWPTRDQFKEAFMNADVPDDDLERARKNLAKAKMQERMEDMEMDARMNYDLQMQEHQNRVYYSGQAPPISILNPAAWAEFIKAWREGRFSDQK